MQKKLQISLLVIGFLQIAGFVTQIDILRGLGTATVASPLPFVFSQFRGFETYAAKFIVLATTNDGQKIEKQMTPAFYNSYKGPYNFRNTFGAVFAYGPKFSTPKEIALRDNVLRFGFCHHGPLASGFSRDAEITSLDVTVTGTGKGDTGPWTFGVNCL